MSEFDLIETSLDFMEVVHVELADKRIQIIVLKIGRQNALLELLAILDLEILAIMTPSDDFQMLALADYLE